MWTCKEKGICYNCDEKFTWGDKCAEKNLHLLDVASSPALEIHAASQDPVDDQVDSQLPPIDPPYHENHLEISLHALAGVIT